jgi:oxygen-independent coproporphyrinogen-3 oxidase
MEEFMFLGLRQTSGVSRAKFEECFSMPIEAVYRDVIEQLKAEGLLTVREGRISLTEKGLDLSNYAMAKFLF